MVSFVAVGAGIAVALFVFRKYREYQWGFYKKKHRLDGKVIIITGGNSGIGLEAARDLTRRGATVILACRNKTAAQEAIRGIKSTSCDGEVIFIELDLANLSSVRRCAQSILSKFSRIDVLVNNAGVSFPREVLLKTMDGHEIHYGVNHLGHFLLTNLLLDRIKKTPYSRIVIVSSLLYKNGKLFDGGSERKNGHTNPLYRDSKLANIYHARELHKRIKGDGASVFVLCPGFTYTRLFRHATQAMSWFRKIAFFPIGYLFMRSSVQGAQTTIMCCVEPSLSATSFGFFTNCQEADLHPVALDDELGPRLWRQSELQCLAFSAPLVAQ